MSTTTTYSGYSAAMRNSTAAAIASAAANAAPATNSAPTATSNVSATNDAASSSTTTTTTSTISTPSVPLIHQVVIDGLVVSKIIAHAKAHLPEYVSGQLLGLADYSGTLDVSNSFPLPQDLPESEEDAYKEKMLRMMNVVNADDQIVGWYQTVYFGSVFDAELVDTQYRAQLALPNFVWITYDPYQSTKGRLVLKAWRLSSKFMRTYVKGSMTQDLLCKMRIESSDIFDELPVLIHNSHLIHGFLYELREQNATDCDAERLSLAHSTFIQTNLNLLSTRMETFNQDQMHMLYNLRDVARKNAEIQRERDEIMLENNERVEQNKKPLDKQLPQFVKSEQDRLNPLMSKAQMSFYLSQLNDASSAALSKLYVVDALRKE